MTIIKITAFIYADVEDGEDACMQLNDGLENAISHFPGGEILKADVDHFENVTDEQIKDLGFDE